MTKDSYRRAAALVGARLRGDEDGEQALIGACGSECRDLIEGLLVVAVKAVETMAVHDEVTMAEAAEVFARLLRDLPGGS
jgi:hypothetical protein